MYVTVVVNLFHSFALCTVRRAGSDHTFQRETSTVHGRSVVCPLVVRLEAQLQTTEQIVYNRKSVKSGAGCQVADQVPTQYIPIVESQANTDRIVNSVDHEMV